MSKTEFTRRQFIAAASAASLTPKASGQTSSQVISNRTTGKLAILGGEAIRKNKSWPEWPYWDQKVIDSVVETTKSRNWCRIQAPETGTVARFEKEFARLTGARFCVATGAGTQALHTCVEALGLGPGDEIITSPYTDPGTIAGILSARALPVLADLDGRGLRFRNGVAQSKHRDLGQRRKLGQRRFRVGRSRHHRGLPEALLNL